MAPETPPPAHGIAAPGERAEPQPRGTAMTASSGASPGVRRRDAAPIVAGRIAGAGGAGYRPGTSVELHPTSFWK